MTICNPENDRKRKSTLMVKQKKVKKQTGHKSKKVEIQRIYINFQKTTTTLYALAFEKKKLNGQCL